MKTCSQCGLSKPLTEFYRRSLSKDGLRSDCKDCAHVRSRRWYEENTEKHREQGRRWVAANHEKRLAVAAKYRDATREACRERIAAWAKRNPSKRAEAQERRRSLKLGAEVSPIDRDAIIARDGARCHFCGKRCRPSELHLDHLVPLSRGGAHAPENVAVACAACNTASGPGRLPAQLRLVG
jgi:5-methylcytosine-specific restriction endonuclease McrA